MAETEITTSTSPTPETTPGRDDSRATIALSEENLLALLGQSSKPAPLAKPAAAPPAASQTAPPGAPVQPPVAPVSAAPPAISENGQPTATPIPVDASPTIVSAQVIATPVVPSAPPAAGPTPPLRKAPAPQSSPENVGSTLALLAAIKENRAELLRSEASSAKPVSQPVPANLAPAAKFERTRPPAPETTAAPVPVKATAPAPLTITERIDRHPAMPPARNTAQAASASFSGGFQTAAPAPSALDAAIEKLPGGRRTLLLVGALIAVGGITTGLVMRGHRTPAKPPVAAAVPAPVAAPPSSFPLQLLVEPQGKGQINVRWNPQSTLIAQSREGRLVITENNQKPRTIPLALDQLRFGHLMYQPQTERVEFRLEVVDPSGAVAEESVLSLATPASGNPPAALTAPGTPPTASATGTPVQQKIEAPPPPVAGQVRPATRVFSPPTVNRTPEQGSIEDAPVLAASNPAIPAPFASLPAANVAAPPPPSAAAANQGPRQIQVASNLQAAKLIKRVTPPYPALAKAARLEGTVRFKATISKEGAVQNLEVLAGPPLLRQAAIDSVKQWTYRPTLLNGRPVEVVTSIDVLFTLTQ